MSTWVQIGNAFERPLGDSEYAFFPASQDALGDMFLHLAFRAPKTAFRRERVKIAWSLIRRSHPMLMCKVVTDGNDLTTARFSLNPPSSPQAALAEADAALRFTHESKHELISNYMDGPRQLSNNFLSLLVISTPNTSGDDAPGDVDFDLMMCAPHFIGDGTSLHQSTHDLFCIITSSKSDAELLEELSKIHNWAALPPAFETRLSGPKSAIGKAAAKVNFLQTLGKEIGGHTFSRKQRGPKRTGLIEHAFTEEQTVAILAHCKANKVTVNHALSALCNVAWGRTTFQSTELPMMMYTAVNLRPHLSPHDSTTYWYLALTYFNIVLPSFLPSSKVVFWHRARLAKAQTHRTTNSPYLVSRALQMASIRGSRARGLPQPPPPPETFAPPAPSAALLGLSLIGNLDRTYTRASYPSYLELHSVTTASRLKAGGMLLLEHTFAGKLWLHLCWDEMGFEEGHVEGFWEELKSAVEEYLC